MGPEQAYPVGSDNYYRRQARASERRVRRRRRHAVAHAAPTVEARVLERAPRTLPRAPTALPCQHLIPAVLGGRRRHHEMMSRRAVRRVGASRGANVSVRILSIVMAATMRSSDECGLEQRLTGVWRVALRAVRGTPRVVVAPRDEHGFLLVGPRLTARSQGRRDGRRLVFFSPPPLLLLMRVLLLVAQVASGGHLGVARRVRCHGPRHNRRRREEQV